MEGGTEEEMKNETRIRKNTTRRGFQSNEVIRDWMNNQAPSRLPRYERGVKCGMRSTCMMDCDNRLPAQPRVKANTLKQKNNKRSNNKLLRGPVSNVPKRSISTTHLSETSRA